MAIEAAANRLLQKSPEILHRWEAKVRAEVAGSKGTEGLVLRNRLDLLLSSVARLLSPEIETSRFADALVASQAHGADRARMEQYALSDVFLEYRLLRQTVLEVLGEGGTLSPDEREAITDSIERALQEAGVHYVLVQQDAERQRTEALRAAYERERRIATILQRPLQLKVPEDSFPDLSVATIMKPAKVEAEVGGDFLDAFALPAGRIALVVGDSSGKGLDAAVHNTHVKDVLRAFLREQADAASTLRRLNDAVCDILHLDSTREDKGGFIALSLAIVDPNGLTAFACAGSDPPLLVRQDGQTEVLPCEGMLLGIHPQQAYKQVVRQMSFGDTLVLFTDGLTEPRRGDTFLGVDGLARLAHDSLGATSLYDAGNAILEGAAAFAGGALRDDVALILARKRQAPSSR